MKFPFLDHVSLVLATLSMLIATPTAFTYDCKKLRADGHTFDLSSLRGPHSITTTKYHPPDFYNTTYTLDICAPLKHAGKVEDGKICPQNTRGNFSTPFQPVSILSSKNENKNSTQTISNRFLLYKTCLTFYFLSF